MKRLLVLFVALCVAFVLHAQSTVKGTVVDSLSREPLVGVNVTLLRDGKPQKFMQTNAHGEFSFQKIEATGKLAVQVTSMGYKKTRMAVPPSGECLVPLPSTAFVLKEVMVQGAPIRARGDTISFDLTNYADQRDNTLKDVLKKLPGVNVAKDGRISYMGQGISRFTVEGLDLTNGRYNKLTENIKAKDVKKAEVVQHDQPIKALQNKVYTDNIAMNVQLKDSARDQLSATLIPYFLVGEPTHPGVKVNVMQIGKKKQLMYEAEYNRKGDDLARYNNSFDFLGIGLDAAMLPTWYGSQSLYAPIDEERLRFNTSIYGSVNHLTKRGDNETRLNANYVRSKETQSTSNLETYYLGDAGRPTHTVENKTLNLVTDELNLDVRHNINTSEVYGHEKLEANAKRVDGAYSLDDFQWQHVRIPELNVAASIYRMYTLGKGTLSWNSMLDYHHARAEASHDEAHSPIINNLWHTSHSLSYNRKVGYLSQTYAVNAYGMNLAVMGNNPMAGLRLSPSWFFNKETFKFTFAMPVSVERYFQQKKTFVLPSPSIYTTLHTGYHHEWNLSAIYSGSVGSMSQFALREYRTDYRTTFRASGVIPLARILSSQLRYQYNRAVYEFFWNVRASYSKTWNNTMADMQIVDGNYYLSLAERHSTTDNSLLGTTLSKGFYKLHLKTTLSGTATWANGDQLSRDTKYHYSMRGYTLEPTIAYSPSWCSISYEGLLGWNTTKMSGEQRGTLFHWVQNLSATATVGNVDLTYTLLHYRNELQAGNFGNTMLSDVSLVWRLKKVRLRAKLSNIFNKKTYEETTYSGVGVFTHSTTLRPREFMVSVQYAL